jgi:hypothetical protein
MRKLLFTSLAISAIVASGCAGIDPGSVSQVDLNFSNPSSDTNVDLSQMISATDLSRSVVGSGVMLTATQTPGPVGISSKIVRTVVTDATPGTEYALIEGGTTYVEVQEVTTLGTRVWRSYGGKLRIDQNENLVTRETLSDVHMKPFSTVALGTFDLNGSIVVRF